MMISLLWLGTITLNISFVIYLIVYIPQIIHNQKEKNIAQLSLGLHFLLYFSYFFDLFYGFASDLPWQYKTVSIVGCCLVVIQHTQLIKFFIDNRYLLLIKFNLIFLMISLLASYYFFTMDYTAFNPKLILFLGIIARGCGLLYGLPQIIKNKRLASANAISHAFLYLNLSLALLDTVSSWCLDWGWPAKLASPINSIIMLYLLYQVKKYTTNQRVVLSINDVAAR